MTVDPRGGGVFPWCVSYATNYQCLISRGWFRARRIMISRVPDVASFCSVREDIHTPDRGVRVEYRPADRKKSIERKQRPSTHTWNTKQPLLAVCPWCSGRVRVRDRVWSRVGSVAGGWGKGMQRSAVQYREVWGTHRRVFYFTKNEEINA